MELRTVDTREEAAVFELMRAATRSVCVTAYGKATIDAWTDPENSFFVFRRDPDNFGFFEDGDLIAYSSWKLQSGTEDWARVTAAFVRPDLLGRGLGANILGRAEEDIAAKGFGKILLWATTSAIPFYKHMGYAEIGTQMLEVANNHFITLTRMEKRFADGPSEAADQC